MNKTLHEEAALIEHANGRTAQDDNLAVDTFAGAMRHKLLLARIKGKSGWRNIPEMLLYEAMQDAATEGDWVSVGNYAAFLWARNASPRSM